MPENRLNALRQQLKQHSISAFLVPLTDQFQGEYIPACSRRLEWLTGFNGSNGLAIVTETNAAFFTDGRYTIQAKQQVPSFYEQYNMAETSPWQWLAENIEQRGVVGYDPWLHTKKSLQYYENKGIDLVPCVNIVDEIWRNRPASPNNPVHIHPLIFAGKEGARKRQKLAEYLKAKGCDAILLTAPDSVCWLLNIRSNDVPHTPFLLAYALVYSDASADLFVEPGRLPKEMNAHLGNEVQIISPNRLEQSINELKNKTIQLDPSHAPQWFFSHLENVIEADDPCQLWKACKNAVEIEGMRAAHVRDGVVLTKFLYWLHSNAAKGEITELSAADRLEAFRGENKELQDLSFDTISGFGSNGAIVHYRVTEKSSKTLTPNGLYLVDSGGQYPDGTTDVTRTIAIGTPTAEQRHNFTRVLKGHIALALATFPEGTTGSQLDILARNHLWQAGLDYDHGTGHGVGSYLSVHEGPQRISKLANNVALQPGMILSNEPGYYKEGEYGIRIENLVLVIEKPELSKNGKRFFGFETLTLAPMDHHLIDSGLLDTTELEWLEAYHQRVRTTLAPYVDKDISDWLAGV